MIYHLAPNGILGLVLANGSLSSNSSGEGQIRKAIVEAKLVDCIVALPDKLFYNTAIPACLWFISRERRNHSFRHREDEILFIDARNQGEMITRRNRELAETDIQRIADTYHAWRNKDGDYEDEKGFCKAASMDEVRKHSHVLTPGRYVGTAPTEEDNVPFEEQFAILRKKLEEQFEEGERLNTLARSSLSEVSGRG